MAATHSFNPPPAIQTGRETQWQIDEAMPLTQLAIERIAKGRDLKAIVTAMDSETGVGKTVCSGGLALTWTWMFAGRKWHVDPEDPVEGLATLNPHEYFKIARRISESDRGAVVMVDDAEELDARRSMQDLNVKFSWWWMLMRLKQVITIITLPSPAAIDSRIMELADVWINVERRGRARVYDVRVKNDPGDGGVYTPKVHTLEFPDLSGHPELQKLHNMKQDKMDRWEREFREEVEEEGQGLGDVQQAFLAVALKERDGAPWRKVADLDDRLTYSGEWYRQKAEELLS